MQPKTKYLKGLFSLDFGTTKFCLATLRETPGQDSRTVETLCVPAEGMRRGMLANVEQAKAALKQLLELGEGHFDTDITKVVVGVAGSHLGSRIVTVSRPLDGEVVTVNDVRSLMEKAELETPTEGRELLHTIPIAYRLDSREAVEDPVGFRGRTLTGEYFLIDADKFYMKDIVDVCNDCGLQVVRLYSEPFASASVTVPDSYKQLGVALADIGGGTTDGIVFKGGRPTAAFTVNVAGKLMTNDIAIGLSLPPETAEAVKLRFGIRPRPGDAMDVTNIKGERKIIGGEHVAPVLGPRIHELCALLANELQAYKGCLGGGILLTGGGADVKGITEYFTAKLNVPVARARPVLGGGQESGLESNASSSALIHPTKFATVIGLLNLELGRVEELAKTKKNNWTNRYLGQFVNWLRELS